MYELQKPDVMRCIFDLKNVANKRLCGETLPNDDNLPPCRRCSMSMELARLVFRRLHPHQSMYNGYKDEFIAYGINNCIDAFPNKQNKKLLAVLAEGHTHEVIKRLIDEKPTEDIIYNGINDGNKFMYEIERDDYDNWPYYDEQLYLKQDLHFVECFVRDRKWKVDPLKIVKMFLFGHVKHYLKPKI
eukprot:758307_1